MRRLRVAMAAVLAALLVAVSWPDAVVAVNPACSSPPMPVNRRIH